MKRTRVLAYDPGDRWVGFALLDASITEPHTLIVVAGVYDREQGSYNAVEDLKVLSRGNCAVVIEEYRVRPTGFNSFYDGATPKLIGALEYVAGPPVYYAPTADPSAITQTPLGRHVLAWKSRWPKRGAARWHHAVSAWRVLGHYLLVEEPQMLSVIEQGVTVLKYAPEPTLGVALLAPSEMWRLSV